MSNNAKRPYHEVMPVAEHIADALARYCERIEIAGSLRRKRPMVGDIEIVAIPKRPKDLFGEVQLNAPTELDAFLEGAISKSNMIKNGPKMKSFMYGSHKVDLFLPTEQTWGAIYMIRTGSHEFNMWVMSHWAPRQDVYFEKGRLLSGWSRGTLDTPEERDVFDAIGLPFVPPNKRDDQMWLKYAYKEATA